MKKISGSSSSTCWWQNGGGTPSTWVNLQPLLLSVIFCLMSSFVFFKFKICFFQELKKGDASYFWFRRAVLSKRSLEEKILTYVEYFQLNEKISYQCNSQNPKLQREMECMFYLVEPPISPFHLDNGNLRKSRSAEFSGLFEIQECDRYNKAPTIAAASYPYFSAFSLSNKIFKQPSFEFKCLINELAIQRDVQLRNWQFKKLLIRVFQKFNQQTDLMFHKVITVISKLSFRVNRNHFAINTYYEFWRRIDRDFL